MRKFEKIDKENFISMAKDFYNTDSVLYKSSTKNFENTFNEILKQNPFILGYIIEYENETSGYVLLSKMYSNEFGGYIFMLEELFIKDKFRNKGLASKTIEEVLYIVEKDGVGIRLEVEPEHYDLMKFYNKFGFDELKYKQMIKIKKA